MSAINYVDLAGRAKRAAAECIAVTRRSNIGTAFRHAPVAILAIDEAGAQIGGALDWFDLSYITPAQLAGTVHERAPAQYHHIELAGWVIDNDLDERYGGWNVSTQDERSEAERRGAPEYHGGHGIDCDVIETREIDQHDSPAGGYSSHYNWLRPQGQAWDT